jgi:hypothetical protein
LVVNISGNGVRLSLRSRRGPYKQNNGFIFFLNVDANFHSQGLAFESP